MDRKEVKRVRKLIKGIIKLSDLSAEEIYELFESFENGIEVYGETPNVKKTLTPEPKDRPITIEFNGHYIPQKGTEGSSGYDLKYNSPTGKNFQLFKDVTMVVPTGIKIAIPKGYEGLIRPRSSVSSNGVHVHIGTIDSDYRGEIKVIMTNLSQTPMTVEHGDRIAQLVIHKLPETMLVFDEFLPETKRGEQGFGSTGNA